MKYLSLVLFAFLMILLQDLVGKMLAGEFFFAEISLLLVIFAGLRMKGLKGAFLVFFLALFFDALAGTPPGLQGMAYALVFFISVAVSPWANIRFLPFAVVFVFLIVFGKELLLGGYYHYGWGVFLGDDFWVFALSQAIIMALVAPFFFILAEKWRLLEKNENPR